MVSLLGRVNDSLSLSSFCLCPFSPAYFVAFEHVLAALRQPETLGNNPLSGVIITETSGNDPPDYLMRGYSRGIDITSIMKDRTVELFWHPQRDGNVETVVHGGSDATLLDRSQLAAFEHCLSHRVALVVGPPGTGKSYTGVQLARVLVNHLRRLNSGPLMIFTYTNHALDQVLEDLYPYSPSLIRCGKGNTRGAHGADTSSGVPIQSLDRASRESYSEYTDRHEQLSEVSKSQRMVKGMDLL